MKTSRIEYMLAMSAPSTVGLNHRFTTAVMTAVKHNEIHRKVIRTLGVKGDRETFFMKLKNMPTIMLILMAIIAALAISVTSYALYELIFKPHVVQQSVGVTSSGRSELVFDITDCGSSKGKTRYELKKNATITKDQVKDIVEAQCELQLVNEWLMGMEPDQYNQHKHTDKELPVSYKKGETIMSYMAMQSPVVRIKDTKNQVITVMDNDLHNAVEQVLPTSVTTKYLVNGKLQNTPNGISANDPVVFQTLNDYKAIAESDCQENCSAGGYPVKKLVTYVVKLSRPFATYDSRAASSIIELSPCPGNEDSDCRQGNIAGVFVFGPGDGGGPGGNLQYKQIEGTIAITGADSFTITASSGKNYTIEVPYDYFATFNNTRLAEYNIPPVGIGDTVQLSYFQSKYDHGTTVSKQSLEEIMVLMEILGKGDELNKF